MKRAKSQLVESEARNYLIQVKDFTEEHGIDYKEFTSLLQEAAYTSAIDTEIPNFIKKVKYIFGDRQDLIVGLNTFLPDKYKINVQVPSAKNEFESEEGFRRILSYSEAKESGKETDSGDYYMKELYKKGIDLFERVKANIASDANSDEYLKFLNQVHGYNRKKIAMVDLIQSFGKHPQVKAELEEFLEQCENVGTHKRLKFEKKRTSPSYWHMPTESNNTNGHSSDLLNNKWVCKSFLKEEDFKNRHVINPRAVILNRCEDDRHELDVYLNRLRSTVAKMEEILELMMSENKIMINIQDHLSVLHFKCVEKLYCEWSHDVIEALVIDPEVVVPVILASFRDKVKECEEYRIGFNGEVWVPIQAGNYLMPKAEQEDTSLKLQLN